ncbi:MAG: hypothetical protein GY898_12415 [Proteobacteria bacterium]|nr:hypothetical protein [Pseudomonadota bacterium]
MVAPIANVSPHDAAGARAEAATPSQEVGEEEFLNLLMTQLSNQDPLNPMDSAQFMEQIASMNSVKQLMDVNVGMDQLMLGLTSLNNQSAVDMVGKEVVARGNTVVHEAGDSPHALLYELDGPAEEVTITIRDSAGQEVETHTVPTEQLAGEHTWTWAPDSTQPAGEYTFEVSAIDEDNNAVTTSTYVSGLVEELRFDSGMPVLMVNGNEVTLDGILRVMDAGDPPVPAMPDSFPEIDPTVIRSPSS